MPGPKKPGRISLGGETYYATVFLILAKNPDGSPSLCRLIPDDHQVELAGGEEFLICYVSATMLRKPQ